MEEELVYHQRIKLPYRYTAGEANEAFLRGLSNRTVVGARCEECNLTLVPARPFCPNCFGRTGDRIEVGQSGVLVSFAVEPSGRTVGLVRLDGADTVLAHLVEGKPDTLALGMRVRARWADETPPEITAIAAFEPE